VNPLTGLAVDPARLNRRPLAVKVSNYPAVVVPQHGLSAADLVYEAPVEGGVTRFTAIYLSQDAERVGSIRSIRLIDFDIQAMYNAYVAYSGASYGITQRALNWMPLSALSAEQVGCPPFCRYPEGGQAYEHTLFTSTSALWEWTDARDEQRAAVGYEVLNTQQTLDGLAFHEYVPSGGTAATQLDVSYTQSSATWRYDSGSERYLRTQNGAPHVDAATGGQLSAANVVIIEAVTYEDRSILEDQYNNLYSIGFRLTGSGPAYLLRDGQMYSGQWVRSDRDSAMQFVGNDGELMRFKPGNTWFQVVPEDVSWWDYWEIGAP
jgi:hypothetical protein